jgi:putative flippase GtrA
MAGIQSRERKRADRPVTVVRALYLRFRQVIHEFAKFGVIGVIGLLITNVGYALLHSHGVGPVTSTTVATIIATIVAYVGNRYWSFRHRERTGVAREGVIFFALNGIGLLIQDGVVALNYYIVSPWLLGTSHNKLAEFLALNAGIAIATLFRFWSYRRFVWLARADDTGAPAAHAPVAPAGPQPGTQSPPGTPLPGAGPLPGIPHANGHAPAARAARNGSYTRG